MRTLTLLLALCAGCGEPSARGTPPVADVELAVAVFRVEDMTCGGCEAAIRTAVRRLDGVHEVDVDHGAGSAHVRYDPSRLTPAAIAAAISELGYPASVDAIEPAEVSTATAPSASGFDPEMAAICQAGCAARQEYDAADVVGQPGAHLGELTRCPVSGVVFEVQSTQPSLVRDGQTWFTCCGACMEKLQANPTRFLGG